MGASMDPGPDPTRDRDLARDGEHVHPLDEQPTRPIHREPEPVVARRGRGLGANRHLGSMVLSLVAVIVAYGLLDYGFYRAYERAQVDLDSGAIPDRAMIALGAAAACLFLAALAGRISGLGPLVAGVVLGAAPAVWVFLDFASYVRRLDDVPEMWDQTTFGLSFISFALYPVVTGLLIGAGVVGRWRRPAPAARSTLDDRAGQHL